MGIRSSCPEFGLARLIMLAGSLCVLLFVLSLNCFWHKYYDRMGVGRQRERGSKSISLAHIAKHLAWLTLFLLAYPIVVMDVNSHSLLCVCVVCLFVWQTVASGNKATRRAAREASDWKPKDFHEQLLSLLKHQLISHFCLHLIDDASLTAHVATSSLHHPSPLLLLSSLCSPVSSVCLSSVCLSLRWLSSYTSITFALVTSSITRACHMH